jgi:uncharacterized membrane protein YvlD (DUF360 family)
MIRFLIRIALNSLTFMYVLPLIRGIHFHGGWASAAGLAIFFSIMLWAVEGLVFLVCALLTVSTFGLGLLVVVPFWIFGFWLLPALTLKLVSDFMPNTLVVGGWLPAILGGFVLLIISTITSGPKRLHSVFGGGKKSPG